MLRVVFALPFALDSSLRFVRGALALEGVQIALVTQERPERLPEDVRAGITTMVRISDALNVDSLERGVREAGEEMGGVDRLIGILEPLQETMAVVRERLGIRGMDFGEAQNFRDKARMKEALAAADLPCAEHAKVTTTDAALSFAHEIGFPLVVKPPAGAGAKATFRVENEEELRSALRTIPPRAESPLLLEEFVQGREFSFDSVNLNGQHLFHSISCYYPTPLEVMENPWVQWCVLLPRSIDELRFASIRSAGPRALEVLGMVTGITHMEWFQRDDGSIAISEVAARPPGAQFTTLLSAAHDLDFYQAWSRLLIFEEFDVPVRKYAAGSVYLRGVGGQRVTAVRGLEEARSELDGLVFEAKLPEPGQPKAESYEGEGYILLRHPETSEVEKGLRWLLQNLQVEMA